MSVKTALFFHWKSWIYMARLSEKEVSLALEKIRKKYQDYASIYNAEVFSYNQFRERYRNYLYTGGSLDVFLFAEIQALEDRKQELDSRVEKRKRVLEAQDLLEKKGEELLLKIQGYPEKDFHPDARLEIKKLVAVLETLYETLAGAFYDVDLKDRPVYQKALSNLKDFMMQPFSGSFARYWRELCYPMKDMKKREALEQAFLKDQGVALATFIETLKRSPENRHAELVEILKRVSEDFRLNIFNALKAERR